MKTQRIIVLALPVLAFYLGSGKHAGPERSSSAHLKNFRQNVETNYRMGKYGALTGLMILKKDSLIYESASNGLYPVESITKSVVSLLAGIALKRGEIPGLNARVADYFPEYKGVLNKNLATITIKDLLTMRSGISWNEDERPEFLNPVFQMQRVEDVNEYIVSREWSNKKDFNYSSANAALLSQIFFKCTGRSVSDYADEFLFKPLGIRNYKWSNYKNGLTNTSGGLFLSIHDLAKIGRLCLEQRESATMLLDSGWIADSFKAHSHIASYADVNGYGYLWWVNDHYKIPGSEKIFKMCSACGFNNNHIILVPELELMIVTTGNSIAGACRYLKLLDEVLEEFRDSGLP